MRCESRQTKPIMICESFMDGIFYDFVLAQKPNIFSYNSLHNYANKTLLLVVHKNFQNILKFFIGRVLLCTLKGYFMLKLSAALFHMINRIILSSKAEIILLNFKVISLIKV